MSTINFKFNLGEKVVVRSKLGIVVGLMVYSDFCDVRQVLVEFENKLQTRTWYFEDEVNFTT